MRKKQPLLAKIINIFGLWGCLLGGSLPGISQNEIRFSSQHGQMGTRFNLVLFASDSLTATAAAQRVWQLIDTLNAHLSDYQPESELSLLSTLAVRKKLPVSEHCWHVLRHARRAAHLTDGAFDPTCGPLTRLWRRGRSLKEVPDSAHIAAAMQHVGYRKLRVGLQRHWVRLAETDMQLDLGGIAKGYAADEALRLLRQEFGITRALLDAGGDITLGDSPPDAEGWLVALDSTHSLILKNCAIATSGKAFRYIEAPNGTRYSHILDLRTGWGLTHPRTVTVIAPTGIEADYLATALSIATPKSAQWHTLQRKFGCYHIGQMAQPNGLGRWVWIR